MLKVQAAAAILFLGVFHKQYDVNGGYRCYVILERFFVRETLIPLKSKVTKGDCRVLVELLSHNEGRSHTSSHAVRIVSESRSPLDRACNAFEVKPAKC